MNADQLKMKYRCIGCNEIHEDVDFCEEEGDTKIEDCPKCSICDKPMMFSVDTITKKLSRYLWEFDCNCHSNKFKLSRG